MEQQQGTAYQSDLFGRTNEDTLRPSHNRAAISGAESRKELQVIGAAEQSTGEPTPRQPEVTKGIPRGIQLIEIQ